MKLRTAIAAALALIAVPAVAGGHGNGDQPLTAPAYTDPLPSEPKAIVEAFFRDHTAWNAFAQRHYARTRDFTAAEQAYRRLIDLYCGPDKEHQGLVFGSDPAFDAERARIVAEREEGARRIVTVHHTTDTGFLAVYDFVFVRRPAGWRVEEVFYFDDYGEEWLPRL